MLKTVSKAMVSAEKVSRLEGEVLKLSSSEQEASPATKVKIIYKNFLVFILSE